MDHLSIIYRSGWSVLVQGHGQEVTTALDPRHARLRDHFVEPWAPGAKDHWLAIRIERLQDDGSSAPHWRRMTRHHGPRVHNVSRRQKEGEGRAIRLTH